MDAEMTDKHAFKTFFIVNLPSSIDEQPLTAELFKSYLLKMASQFNFDVQIGFVEIV
jgi:hypothetical protein